MTINEINRQASEAINTRREETNRTIENAEASFQAYKEMVISLPNASALISERREETNQIRVKAGDSFQAYKTWILDWANREISELAK